VQVLGTSSASPADTSPATSEDTASLSFVQEQLWFVEQFAPDRGLYSESVGARFRGRLDVGVLERALDEIARRHEILRTVFPVVDGRPVQRVLAQPAGSILTPVDLSHIPETDREETLMRSGQAFVERPSSLDRDTLFRCMLARLSETDHALLVVVHHLVSDAWSVSRILEELRTLYEAFLHGRPSPLPEPELQYADFACWERELLATGILDEDVDYWTRTMARVPAALELPTDRPRPPLKGVDGARDEFPLGNDLAAPLLELSRDRGVTPFATVLAGFAALVTRYARQTDFVLGTLVANRPRPELETTVGQFSNTLPLRLDLGEDPTFFALLERCRDVSFEALDHAHLALEKIVEVACPGRDPGHNALIQHLIALRQAPVREGTMADVQITAFEVPRSRGRLDTIFEVEMVPGTFRVWVEYDTALFDYVSIERLTRDFGQVFATWLTNPELRVSELPIVAPEKVAALTTPEAGPPPPERSLVEPAQPETDDAPTVLDPLQTVLAGIWCEVMGLDEVGPRADFFELGGHSMLSAKLVERIRDALRINLPLRALFVNPTLDQLTAEIRRGYPEIDAALNTLAGLHDEAFGQLLADVAQDPGPPAPPAPRPTLLPLSAAQVQLWLMEQLRPGQLTYTIPLSVRISGPLDVDALRTAIRGVVARHEGLRTTFVQIEGRPMQRVAAELVLPIPLADLSEVPPAQRQAELHRIEQKVAHRQFNLGVGPLLHAETVRLAATDHRVLLNFHHLVTDEVSMTLFLREVSEIYAAAIECRSVALPNLPVQFGEYVAWEQQRPVEHVGRLERYWMQQLRGVEPLALPTDHPRPAELTFKGEFLTRLAPLVLFEEVAALARQYRVTPFLVFTAVAAELLHRLSGQEDLVVGAPSENRTMPGSELLIGCFLNVLPLRIDCSADPTFVELLHRVRDTLLTAYDHQDLPLSRIVEVVRPPRHANRLPLVQATCELQLGSWMPLTLRGCRVEYDFVTHETARYELAFHGMVKPDHLLLALELNTNLWEESTGHRLLADLEAALAEVVRDPSRRLSTYAFRAGEHALRGRSMGGGLR
jgi:non-ribosomal peptide synthetase component F